MANLLKASGEITITDISDSVQLSSYISSTLQRQVIYDPNDKVYVPNFANTNNILVPQLYITGNTEDIILQAKSVKWFYQLNSTGNKIPITADTADYTLNATTKQLTIKSNVLKDYNSIHYTVEIVFTDPNSMADVFTQSNIEIIKITNGVNGVDGDSLSIGVLTNDSHNIPTDSEGKNGNYSLAESSMKVYEGNKDATNTWNISITPSESVQGILVNDTTPSGLNRNLFVFNTSTNQYMYEGVVYEADQNDRLSVPILIPDITKPYFLTWRGGSVGTEAFMNVIYLDENGEYISESIMANYDIPVAPYTMSLALSFPLGTRYVRVNGSQLNNNGATLKFEQGTAVTAYSPAPEDVTIIGEKIFRVTDLTSDIGTVTFTASKTGFPSIVKVFTLTKTKSGTIGEHSTSYWLTGYPTAIKKNSLNVYTPANFNVSIMSQTGIDPPKHYSGRFVIQETIDNSTWSTKYSSSADESNKSFVPSAGIKAVRVRIYLSGGTTVLIDEQTVPIVEDGSDPVIAVISTPKGSVIKNSVGNLEAELILYKGGQAVTGTGFKWYELDTTVTGGWRQLTSTNPDGTSGYATNKLVVTPASIMSTNTYKGVTTYNGIEYYEMVTFTDITDPISTVIVGTSIFKNGTGENTFTAIAYQNGVEIDKAGTKYLYKWSMINSSGVVNSSWTATGKTIKVLANQYVNITQLKCDLDDRK